MDDQRRHCVRLQPERTLVHTLVTESVGNPEHLTERVAEVQLGSFPLEFHCGSVAWHQC
jgi:hypothetical protein